MFRTKSFVPLIGCLVLLSQNALAQSDLTQKVMGQIKRGDTLLQRGVFVYEQHPEERSLALEAADDFIKERNPKWRDEIVADRIITLSYANSRFSEKTLVKTSKPTEWRDIYDGEDSFQIFSVRRDDWEKKSVVVKSGGKPDASLSWASALSRPLRFAGAEVCPTCKILPLRSGETFLLCKEAIPHPLPMLL